MTPLAKLAVGRTRTATRTFDPVSSIIIMVAAVSKADEGKAGGGLGFWHFRRLFLLLFLGESFSNFDPKLSVLF